jgi:predicted DNA-binding transcriptional regulator AlpA
MNIEKRYLTGPQVDQRYGITPMTRWRWEHDPDLGFPKALKLNPHKGGRKLYAEDDLEAWERKRAAASLAAVAAHRQASKQTEAA